MNSNQLKKRIEESLNGICLVNEFSGGNDHYSVVVVSEKFVGKTSLQRHRMVMDLFKEEVATGEVHALSIQAFTPAQWEEKQH